MQEEQKKGADCTIADKCSDLAGVPKVPLSTKKSLKGHINKVNSVHFSDDSRYSLRKRIAINDKNVQKKTINQSFIADTVSLALSMEN